MDGYIATGTNYPDNFRADLCPSEARHWEPSADAECAFRASDQIEALKDRLAQAIKDAKDLPGISELYGELSGSLKAISADLIWDTVKHEDVA